MFFSKKEKKPLTRFQKGRRWSTWTLVLTGLFSIWFNVRSGRIAAEPIAFSAMPVIVLFLTIHLITYLNPRKWLLKVLIYVGLGLVTAVAFGMSGYHLYSEAVANGQPWLIAITYPFIVDVPSVISAVILVEKVPTAQVSTVKAEPVKRTVPAKAAKAAPTATKRTSSPKAKTPAKVTAQFIPPSPLTDPLEKDMLTA
jgi:hypothetical protein